MLESHCLPTRKHCNIPINQWNCLHSVERKKSWKSSKVFCDTTRVGILYIFHKGHPLKKALLSAKSRIYENFWHLSAKLQPEINPLTICIHLKVVQLTRCLHLSFPLLPWDTHPLHLTLLKNILIDSSLSFWHNHSSRWICFTWSMLLSEKLIFPCVTTGKFWNYQFHHFYMPKSQFKKKETTKVWNLLVFISWTVSQ